MWLEQIVLKDFRCFYDENSIDLSTDPEKNVTLIHAENGVGKTTLLNALLWCFYAETTAKFERRDDLVNYDARAEGRTYAFVEVLFRHNGKRYRARRYTKGGGGEREFIIMRLSNGHHESLPNPDAFISTVLPRGMASHFLFDGEHAEVFLGNDNRASIRKAVQDILGCTLVQTAIKDLAETSTYYRQRMPTSKATAAMKEASARIDTLKDQVEQGAMFEQQILGSIEGIKQQIADIEETLRNSSAAKQIQKRRDTANGQLAKAKRDEASAQAEILKFIGESGRYLVSTKITDFAMDFLDQKETKGRIPAPYNEELVKDLLELQKCICERDLLPGSPAHTAVAALIQRAANATLRDRIKKVNTRISELRRERERAPARFEKAKSDLIDAREQISQFEAELEEISTQLTGIDFDDISKREAARNTLLRELEEKNQTLGQFRARIARAKDEIAEKERELKRLAAEDEGAKVFVARYSLCETLKGRLERELQDEEKEARRVLRASINRVLARTSRKAFRLHMSDDYGISLQNESGTQLPKSSGENQLLGLAFTAALVEFAKLRQNAEDYRLLRGTVAPLVLDSPFGQLDEAYRQTTAEYIPEMATQVVLLVSKSQSSGGVMGAIEGRIGEEYVLVRHNKSARQGQIREIRQLHGRDIETAVFDSMFDGSSFVKVTTNG